MTNQEYVEKNFGLIFQADQFIHSDQFKSWNDFKQQNDQILKCDSLYNSKFLTTTFGEMVNYYLRNIGSSFWNDIGGFLYQAIINDYLDGEADNYYKIMIDRMNQTQVQLCSHPNKEFSRISLELGMASLDFTESFQWNSIKQ